MTCKHPVLAPLRLWLVCGLGLSLLLSACETQAPKPNLPPSESDLVLLKSTTLCTSKPDFLKTHPASTFKTKAWGSGQELVLPADRSPSHGDESYFFDEDGLLVGTLFTFPSGLDLNPYPILRHTLTLLKPVLEFYLNVANLSSKSSMDSSALYETGDEKTTTQYLVLGSREQPTLLQASVTIDPYVRLFSPYRREFLERLRHPSGQKPGQQIDSQGAEDKEALPLAPAIRARPNRTALLLWNPELRYRSQCLSESDRERLYEQSVAGRSSPQTGPGMGREGTAREGQDGDASVVGHQTQHSGNSEQPRHGVPQAGRQGERARLIRKSRHTPPQLCHCPLQPG